MANLPRPALKWLDKTGPGEDPGSRVVQLPAPLPEIGNDFDWQQRDFESFRQTMLQGLQLQFPERKRWSPGDMESVLIELLAAHLDQLSDMADRVSAEAGLETARRLGSLVKWFDFIDYDPSETRAGVKTLEDLKTLYQEKPHEMLHDRLRAPAAIRRQRRMASLLDYTMRLEEHPLVLRARAAEHWTGSWFEFVITVSLYNDWRLDDALMTEWFQLPERVKQAVQTFHQQLGLRKLGLEQNPTTRELLLDYIRAYRMIGHVVTLEDVILVDVLIEVCVSIRENYFQSEVRREVVRVLGRGPEGFFRPGRLTFGQDIQLSDIYGALMPIDGVQNVRIVRFGKVADDPQPLDRPVERIIMGSHELAVCGIEGKGAVIIKLAGGRPG